MYATDTSQRVAELSPDLGMVRLAGGGSGQATGGEFRFVQGSLTVGPDGSVYVADTGNFRVQVFTPAGRFVCSIGEFGNGPGQFTWPFDLAVDAAGNVYVADDKEQTVAKLSPSGRRLPRRGGLAETDERLQGHEHLAMVDADGRLLTVNDDRGLVMLLGPDGSVAQTMSPASPGRGGVCDATLDPERPLLPRVGGLHTVRPGGLRRGRHAGRRLGGSGPGAVAAVVRRRSGYAVTAEGGVVEIRAETD